MTHSTNNLETENGGSLDVAYHDIDITSLDSAGQEDYDPESETNLSGADRYGVEVVAQEDATKRFSWDHTNGHLDVVEVSDATDVSDNTDCGRVILRVVGA